MVEMSLPRRLGLLAVETWQLLPSMAQITASRHYSADGGGKQQLEADGGANTNEQQPAK